VAQTVIPAHFPFVQKWLGSLNKIWYFNGWRTNGVGAGVPVFCEKKTQALYNVTFTMEGTIRGTS